MQKQFGLPSKAHSHPQLPCTGLSMSGTLCKSRGLRRYLCPLTGLAELYHVIVLKSRRNFNFHKNIYAPGRNSSVPRVASTGWNRQPASPALSATTRNSSARTRTSRASPKRWCPAGTFLRCMVKPPFVSELCAILCRAVPIVCGRKMWYTVTDKSRRNCYADHYTAGYGGHHAPAGPCPDRRAGRMRGPCPAV